MKLDVQVTKYEMRSDKHVYVAARLDNRGWCVHRRLLDAAPIPPCTQELAYTEKYNPNSSTEMNWVPVLKENHGLVFFRTFPELCDFVAEDADHV